jgi:hypothetical protein
VEEDESTVGEGYEKAVGDRTFQKFARRVECAPEQILRYPPLNTPSLLLLSWGFEADSKICTDPKL